MILLNKHNLVVADFASKEKSRYTLSAIQVTPTETVATNGHMLAVVTNPKVDEKNFPFVPGFVPSGAEIKPFLLELDTAEKVAKALPKKPTIPILENAAISVADNGDATITVTDLNVSQVIQQKKIDGNFCNWQTVMPTGTPTIKIAFDAHYLLTIAKAAIALSDSRQSMVTLSIYSPTKAMKFEASNSKTGQTLTGAIMPLRTELL